MQRLLFLIDLLLSAPWDNLSDLIFFEVVLTGVALTAAATALTILLAFGYLDQLLVISKLFKDGIGVKLEVSLIHLNVTQLLEGPAVIFGRSRVSTGRSIPGFLFFLLGVLGRS